MRFLLLNQFYPPDPAPTGRMLHDLGKVLVGRGHHVRVVCSRRAYDGKGDWDRAAITDGIEVLRTGGTRFLRNRVAGRLPAYGTFLAGAIRAAIRGSVPETVVSLTTPPFLGVAGALTARLRGRRHAHWTMDVYPDALRAHWRAVGSPVLWTGLEWLARLQFRGASVVIAPGTCIRERLQRYVPSAVPLWSVPLWATEDAVDEAAVARERTARGWHSDDLVLMYSGNMGLGHRFVEFLEAASRLGSTGPRWAFIGDGPRREEIARFRTENPEARIELYPYVDSARLAESLASADVHLVSLAPGWEGVMVPSKVQNAFAVGRPVIFLGPGRSDVAAWISESGGGWVVAPGDTDALIRAVEAARDPAERRRCGQAALAFSRIHFDRQRNCERIATLLEQC